MIRVSYAKLFPFAIIYASAPIAIFFATWLKLILAIPVTLLFIGCLVLAIRSRLHGESDVFTRSIDYSMGTRERFRVREPGELHLSRSVLLALALMALIWCFFGGFGSLWAQSEDWGSRNAIFRDMLTHGWPVRYDGGSSAMSYYMGFWLPAAAVGRTLVRLKVSLDIVWPIANLLLLVWTAAGMFLVELLAIVTVGVQGKKGAFLAVLMLVFFGTPDIVGVVIANRWEQVIAGIHLEWWCMEQISSITTCLYWVFNQAVIPWICTLCFLNERSFRNYCLLWLCTAFCGPLPCVGLAIFMVGQGVCVLVNQCMQRESVGIAVKSIFSIPNVLSIFLAPIVVLFFAANGATSNPNDVALNAGALPYPFWFPTDPGEVQRLLLLVIAEGLVVSVLVARGNMRKPVFWLMALLLPLCQFVRVGNAFDFGMRASIPAVITLYVFCARFLRLHFGKREPRRSWRTQATVLAIVLALGALTPIIEFYRGFYYVSDKGVVGAVEQYDKGTLQGVDFTHSNFGTANPDDTLFYRYLAD